MSADKILFFLSVSLLIIGVVFSLSLSVFTVLSFNYSEYHFFVRQFIVALIGIAMMWGTSRLNPDKFLIWIGFGLFISCTLIMGLMYVLPSSLVTEAGGARRWIRLPGFSLAPVEFFKIGFVYFLAWSFSRKIDNSKKRLVDELKILAPYLFLFMIIIYLIAVLQNDLGQVVVLALTLIIMALFAGTSKKFFGIGILAATLAAIIIIFSSDHRILRIKSWWGSIQDMILSFFPHQIADVLRVDNAPEPYQVGHSLNAIKHGEIFGEGLGAGVIKLGFLSEVHTDFVLAGIAEEVGFVGISVIVILFSFLLFRIFRISSRSENKVYHLFSLGIGLLISFSFLINSYGINSLVPIKGLAVPFLSYGGSSVLAVCISIGMVLMVSKKVKQ
ncbi:cell division protein [Campylobacter pinnipediorum subsp. caledonicus]|uniref:peptidoglycan glycosyltransferase FtsW n=1 Tax=Campylobacter pinnipediorum TaxID=1965231 RepID=UPI00099493A8|nr:putative peptidoglycan glycosyltransferase FtsW [Campylobacter pinnipediorum]AQW85945.1 cell division protein, FtsW/RodA/SpoVE family [Campylobacter pinnipediorum subsp. caledonicus]OPA72308.1 cell division protein [Campylobacter pinnipediorum subsp. caledonicus]